MSLNTTLVVIVKADECCKRFCLVWGARWK